ncbi:TPA: hypothetical protein ACJEU7_003908 [Acinetobacter baumannii]
MNFNPFISSTYPVDPSFDTLTSSSRFFDIDWSTISSKELYSKVKIPTMLRPLWVNHCVVLWSAIHGYIIHVIDKNPSSIINSDVLSYGPIQIFSNFKTIKSILESAEQLDDSSFEEIYKPFQRYFSMITGSESLEIIADEESEDFKEIANYHESIFMKIIESSTLK